MQNFVQPGHTLYDTVTNPASPVSGDPVRLGTIVGVAEVSKDAATKTVFRTEGVFDLSAKAVDGLGDSPVAKGDKLYYVDADTPKLSKKDTGYYFGKALEAIASGQTDTINVLVGQP